MSRFKKIEKSPENIKDILSYPCWAIDGTRGTVDWGITQETVDHLQIRCLASEVDRKVLAYYIPVTKNKETTGFIKVSPDLSKKQGRFQTVGDVSIESDLIGQAFAPQGRKLFIVEGMKDYLIAFQCLREGAREHYKKDMIPAVVTFPLGIGSIKGVTNARQSIANNLNFIENYKEVITCFDNDAGDENVGQLAVQDCALILKDFKNVLLPVNDCWDMFKQEGRKALYKHLLFNGKDYEHGSIVSGVGDEEQLMQPLKKGIYLEALPNTMRLLQGLRERELTVILAPPKCGKTSLCKLIHYQLMLAGKSTLGVYLEEDLVKTKQSFVALHAEVHLPLFRENPSRANKEKVQEAFELLNRKETMFFDDRSGMMTPENVMQQFEWAYIKGAQYILFDHLSFIISSSKGNNERKEIDNLLNDMAAFVKRTGVHIIAVAHITRDKNRPKPKNKDGSIKYPYWYEVEETDGRGSGAFEQVCWNLIAIDKEITEDKSRGKTRTKILYNREWDLTGTGDHLIMDRQTGRLKAVQMDDY